MKNYKIVCICQIYNELEKGHLKRFFKYITPLVDAVVIYDDASTDGSAEYALQHTPFVIRSGNNSFEEEVSHRMRMLDYAKKLKPDYILWLDADEVLTCNKKKLKQLCAYCDIHKADAVKLHEINIWRSHIWRRTDSLYNDGWFVRLWKVTPGLRFYKSKIKEGLHQQLYPHSIKNIIQTNAVKVLHYGFATEKSLAYKYLVYKSRGQRGYDRLDRLISEEKLVWKKVNKNLFPAGLYVEEEKPRPLSWEESLAYVETYKEEVFRPRYSIICMIYKSVDWLKFVYEQVYKYTDMRNKEFYFVANDATDEVLNYMDKHFIPYYKHVNTAEQQKEYYLNNVYRAWNFGAEKARGDFLVFLNSDMAFTPGWLENLMNKYDGSNCIVPRLVESGKFRAGTHGITKNFGRRLGEYNEKKFLKYAKRISKERIKDQGVFMPLLIKKSDFKMIGGFPEGNIRKDSDLYHPIIALQGEESISGDRTLLMKLDSHGIKHQTSFDSVVYHFQNGEIDEKRREHSNKQPKRIALCNDWCEQKLIPGDKNLWNFMLEGIPSIVAVDKNNTGKRHYESRAKKYIRKHYPDIAMIIQNATFIKSINPDIFTVLLLQDDLRSMGRDWRRQKENLDRANVLVANTEQTAKSYPEYDFEVIPLGLDDKLFRPLDRKSVRERYGYSESDTIGIFVGCFQPVKGWEEVKGCIEAHKDFKWILVSKYQENVDISNAVVYNQISQKILVELHNCADFFIVGSPVETQCLAALEACLCNIPVVMHDVGYFKECADEDKRRAGIFTNDLNAGIDQVLNMDFSPRQFVLDHDLTIGTTVQKWNDIIKRNMPNAMNYTYNKNIRQKTKRNLAEVQYRKFGSLRSQKLKRVAYAIKKENEGMYEILLQVYRKARKVIKG